MISRRKLFSWFGITPIAAIGGLRVNAQEAILEERLNGVPTMSVVEMSSRKNIVRGFVVLRDCYDRVGFATTIEEAGELALERVRADHDKWHASRRDHGLPALERDRFHLVHIPRHMKEAVGSIPASIVNDQWIVRKIGSTVNFAWATIISGQIEKTGEHNIAISVDPLLEDCAKDHA
jgi:hypothetical protein